MKTEDRSRAFLTTFSGTLRIAQSCLVFIIFLSVSFVSDLSADEEWR